MIQLQAREVPVEKKMMNGPSTDWTPLIHDSAAPTPGPVTQSRHHINILYAKTGGARLHISCQVSGDHSVFFTTV